MPQETGEDLEALGLIAHSYDALFSVRRRLRKVNDLHVPLRAGLAYSQIGVALLAVIVQFLTLALIVAPLVALLRLDTPWWFPLLWVFGPAVLMAQQVIKPMPHGKGISDTVVSYLRVAFDDPVHARGRGVPRKRQPEGMSVVHYQREWAPFEEGLSLHDSEQAISDVETERRFAAERRNAVPFDFQQWWDDRAFENASDMLDARQQATSKDEERIGSLRGPVATVIIPDNPNTDRK